MVPTITFEALRDELHALEVPQGEARQLIWVVPDRLGVAMTTFGGYEIFLQGAELRASLPLVASNLVYDSWELKAGGSAFTASRVLLGSAPHFAAVAALIMIEFGRFSVSDDDELQSAFTDVEPIIELAIRRGALSDEAVLGLVAELHLLRAALLGISQSRRAEILLGWRGWGPGRDFMFGAHGIEVKATLGATSRHKFSGIHQLEPREQGQNGGETVHLLSMGLEPVDSGGSSLPELIDDILSLLGDKEGEMNAQQLQLISLISRYGGAQDLKYDHITMKKWTQYQQRFSITFTRLYDVADPALLLLDRGLVDQTFAVADSLSFELALPSRVSNFNPADDWQREVRTIVNS